MNAILKRMVLAVSCAALAGGCADTGGLTRVSSEDYASQYDYNQFRLASDGRTFPTLIVGNPFPELGQRDADRRLLAVMQAHKPRPRLTFTLESAVPGISPGHRLVLVFDPANEVGAARVCKGEATSRRHVAGQFSVFAVYCRGDVPMSQAIGRTTAETPEDNGVARLFDELFGTVFSDAPMIQPNHGYPGGLL
jgi:hypothetical protein